MDTSTHLTPDDAPEQEKDAKASFEALLGEVQGLKPVFVGIVDFCRKAKKPAEVDECYEKLTEFNACTFSSVRVRALLEEAGALEYIEPKTPNAADGAADTTAGLVDAAASQPDATAGQPDADDDEYYEITTRPEGVWKATEAGLAVIDGLDPLADLLALLDEEPELASGYEQVLEALLQGPKTISDLQELVVLNSFDSRDRRSAPYLIKQLEERGAVEFRGGWAILPAGEELLSSLVSTGEKAR